MQARLDHWSALLWQNLLRNLFTISVPWHGVQVTFKDSLIKTFKHMDWCECVWQTKTISLVSKSWSHAWCWHRGQWFPKIEDWKPTLHHTNKSASLSIFLSYFNQSGLFTLASQKCFITFFERNCSNFWPGGEKNVRWEDIFILWGYDWDHISMVHSTSNLQRMVLWVAWIDPILTQQGLWGCEYVFKYWD